MSATAVERPDSSVRPTPSDTGRDAARAADEAKARLLDDLHAFAVEFAPKVPKTEAGAFFSGLHEIELRVRAL